MTGRKISAGVLCGVLILLLITEASAEGKGNIIFYDKQAGGYDIYGQYSMFKDMLKSEGYVVSDITADRLTSEKLRECDILILQNLNSPLDVQEILAIREFVAGKPGEGRGHGLFINGGSIAGVNPVAQIFGIAIDTSDLIDDNDGFEGFEGASEGATSFRIHTFNTDSGIISMLLDGVTNLAMNNLHGLFLDSRAIWIGSGDRDTYSNTLTFLPGSQPPVLAATFFGSGSVFVNTDIQMLSNSYINYPGYDNRQLGMNIITWLMLGKQPFNISEPGIECESRYASAIIESNKYKKNRDTCIAEKNSVTQTLSDCDAKKTEYEGTISVFESNQIAITDSIKPDKFAVIFACISFILIVYLLVMFVLRRGKPKELKEVKISEAKPAKEEAGGEEIDWRAEFEKKLESGEKEKKEKPSEKSKK